MITRAEIERLYRRSLARIVKLEGDQLTIACCSWNHAGT